jgi:hypothetical protein
MLDVLGIEHLHYQLIHADILLNDCPYEVYLCASEDFKKAGESKIALDAYYELERNNGESPLSFCIRNGWEDYIYRMLVVDYLILNRDRHGANIEVLRNSRKKTIRLAPLFDHGLSLLFNCPDNEAIDNYDITEDKPTNNFIGSRSTWENLSLIPLEKQPLLQPLRESDREILFEGLADILPCNLQEKIWNMIWTRWCNYENFCNSR